MWQCPLKKPLYNKGKNRAEVMLELELIQRSVAQMLQDKKEGNCGGYLTALVL
jgi:hypothetical protein